MQKQSPQVPKSISELGILPPPFEWIYVPAGEISLTHSTYKISEIIQTYVEAFYIAKYPITNQQYSIYVEETGQEPRSNLWKKPHFNQDLHPVVEIRWYEAMLFCKWLSNQLPYNVTLPTDAQWQRAAQGDDGRKYPWGNQWDSSFCNSSDSGIGHTTPVDFYPQGASPYGVMDMLGNVFEWCITDADTGLNNYNIDEELYGSGEYLFNQLRVAKGFAYHSSSFGISVIEYGGSSLFDPYSTGIRLVYMP